MWLSTQWVPFTPALTAPAPLREKWTTWTVWLDSIVLAGAVNSFMPAVQDDGLLSTATSGPHGPYFLTVAVRPEGKTPNLDAPSTLILCSS